MKHFSKITMLFLVALCLVPLRFASAGGDIFDCKGFYTENPDGLPPDVIAFILDETATGRDDGQSCIIDSQCASENCCLINGGCPNPPDPAVIDNSCECVGAGVDTEPGGGGGGAGTGGVGGALSQGGVACTLNRQAKTDVMFSLLIGFGLLGFGFVRFLRYKPL